MIRRIFQIAGVAALVTCGWSAYAQERGTPAGYDPKVAELNKLPNPYQLVENWAQLPGGRKMGSPAQIEMDLDGKSLWVFERCGGTTCVGSTVAPILKFDQSGKLLTSFGQGMFVFPHGLHIDRDGNVWVTDAGDEEGHVKDKGHQVFKFSPDGKLLMTLGKAGVAGQTNDTFNMPSDVVTAPNGDIFVADGHNPIPTNHRIVKFSKDGKFIKTWGKKGKGPGELDDPHSMVMDSRGRLVVADRRNFRIQIFDQEGRVVETLNNMPRIGGLFLQGDTLYIAESESGIRIGSFKDGKTTTFIKGLVPANGRIRVAESVAVDSMGNVYGAEIGTMKLQKYVKK